MMVSFVKMCDCVHTLQCLMPETVAVRGDEVSEDALRETVHLRRVTAAVNLYDQLLQTGEDTVTIWGHAMEN